MPDETGIVFAEGYMISEAISVVSRAALDFGVATPLYLWAGCFAAGLVLESFLPKAQKVAWQAYALNLAHAAVYLVIIYFMAAPIGDMITWIVGHGNRGVLFDLQSLNANGWRGTIVASILTLCALDFLLYWWHRALHQIPWLWDEHSVHHSDEELNAFSATRVHWTDFMFQAFIVQVPLLILFNSTQNTNATLAVIASAWVMLSHANVRLWIGPLSRIFCAPQMHRIHHSRLPEHRDKNFAFYFSIWDIVFGTYHHPKRDEFPPTGIDGVRLDRVWQLSAYPFIHWGKRIARLTVHS